jgi:hypothetical protein
MLDPFRDELLLDQRVNWWYAQNLVVVVRNHVVQDRPELARYVREPVRRLVHPELYSYTLTAAARNAERLREQALSTKDEQLANVHAELAALRGENQRGEIQRALEEKLRAVEQQLERTLARLDVLTALEKELRAAEAESVENQRTLEKRLQDLEEEHIRTLGQLKAILSSRSWRMLTWLTRGTRAFKQV